MKEIYKTLSTNGRWGLSIVSGDDIDITEPAQGVLTRLGEIGGIATYRFDAQLSGQWFVVVPNLAQPLAGCSVVTEISLQSSRYVTLIAGGEFMAFECIGYKGRKSWVQAFSKGQSVDLPASVMAAMGLIQCKEEVVKVEIPKINNALQEALLKAGL